MADINDLLDIYMMGEQVAPMFDKVLDFFVLIDIKSAVAIIVMLRIIRCILLDEECTQEDAEAILQGIHKYLDRIVEDKLNGEGI